MENGSSRQESIDSNIAASVVRRASGANPVHIAPIEGRGMSARVIAVSTSEGRFVVRLKDIDWLPNFKKESWCLEQAHQQGVPVPRVLDTGIEGSCAYSLAHFVERSSPVSSECDRLRVWNKLGSYAMILNEIPVSGFGSQMTSDGCFSIPTLKKMLQPELEIIFRDDFWERRGILSKQQSIAVEELLKSCATLGDTAGICQWDMCCENALIRNGNPDDVILLDLDQAVSVVVPHHQLAYVAKGWGLNSKIMHAFLKGYGMTTNEYSQALPAVRQLLVLQSMRSVRWAEDRNPAWLEKNLEKARIELTNFMRDHLL